MLAQLWYCILVLALGLECWLWVLNFEAKRMGIPEANPLLIWMASLVTRSVSPFLRSRIHYESIMLLLQPIAAREIC